MRSESAEVSEAVAAIAGHQEEFGERLSKRELGKAAEVQARLDDRMDKALRAWPVEPMIVNLAGYHLKNAYMLKHWDAIQAGRAPDDPLLARAEQRFFETLAIDRTDPSALNGLGEHPHVPTGSGGGGVLHPRRDRAGGSHEDRLPGSPA
jgi:hypothetical protein